MRECAINEDSAVCQSRYATPPVSFAKGLTAEQCATGINPLPATNLTSRHMFATHAETGGIALRISTSTLLRMQTLQPAEEDPKAGKESD